MDRTRLVWKVLNLAGNLSYRLGCQDWGELDVCVCVCVCVCVHVRACACGGVINTQVVVEADSSEPGEVNPP